MINKEVDPSKIELVGHGLGAHVAGIAANRITAHHGKKIDLIVGLDASGLNVDLEDRLDKTDATRVVGIHTNFDSLGFGDPNRYGHLDVYVKNVKGEDLESPILGALWEGGKGLLEMFTPSETKPTPSETKPTPSQTKPLTLATKPIPKLPGILDLGQLGYDAYKGAYDEHKKAHDYATEIYKNLLEGGNYAPLNPGSENLFSGTFDLSDVDRTNGTGDIIFNESSTKSLYGVPGNNYLYGSDVDNWLYGGLGSDYLHGGGGNDTFVFDVNSYDVNSKARSDSWIYKPDHIADFTIGKDKILLGRGSYERMGILKGSFINFTPKNFTRAANSNATNLNDIVGSVFTDANGYKSGNQALDVDSAALVVSSGIGTTGTYLIINNSVNGFQESDLVINITNYIGKLPGFGDIDPKTFFG